MSPSLRILLVDDNPDDRVLIARELLRGFPNVQISQIADLGMLGVAMERGEFDLVITDYQLRWIDGIQVLRRIKARKPDCPVIMFTGTGSEEIAVEAMRAGLDDYVLKSPKHFARLPASVQLALERAEQRRALKEAETRYRSLFEGVPVGLYQSTPEGQFIEVNPAMVKMLGYPDWSALLDISTAELYVHSEDRQRWKELISSTGIILNFEAQFYRFDGTIIWARDTAHMVRGSSGQLLYYEGSMEDITEHKRLEEELLQAAKLESLAVLAGGIAHDFNNILTAILGNISVAKQYVQNETVLAAILEDAEKASTRARSLTQQLLTFSKEGTPTKRTTSIAEIIRDSASFALRGAKTRCEFVLAPDLSAVEADEGQISRVIHNLILNADQAMTGGGLVRIHAENVNIADSAELTIKPGKYVRISIQDHGIGIPEEHLDQIFDPFFTTKPSGSGLGLATTFSIIRKHDGVITVESERGVGTIFHIYLPASDKEAPARSPAEAHRLTGTGRVLVMDDDGIVREITARMLDHLGYSFALAKDGTEALALFQEGTDSGNPFDIVILDLTIPGGEGALETLAKLRELEPDLKAVISSGYSNDPAMSHFQNHGFCGRLTKPYRLEGLGEVLHRALEE
jgi:PAS domain S-box-containing protein